MRCIERDHIVQAFATYGANQTFAMSIGGGHTNGQSQDVDAPAPYLLVEAGRESLVPIMQKELAILIARQRFPELL